MTMKKFYSLLALLCIALVACESATDETTRVAKIDKETLTLERLIAQQSGEFNDEKLLEMLIENSIEMDRVYVMNDKGAWELDWEYNIETDRSFTRTHYLFSEETFTINHIEKETNICSLDNSSIFEDYYYTYDAETNMLTTYCSYDSKAIYVGEKQEAKVVYFDTDIVVFDGYILGNDISRGSMWRTVFKFDTKTRDNIIYIDRYVAEPQNIDCEALFAKMESSVMARYSCMQAKYYDDTNTWSSWGIAGRCFDEFWLEGDMMVFHSSGFDGEYYDTTSEVAVKRDVDNGVLYIETEVPETEVSNSYMREQVLKPIYANERFVVWLYDVTLTKADGDTSFNRSVIVCEFK